MLTRNATENWTFFLFPMADTSIYVPTLLPYLFFSSDFVKTASASSPLKEQFLFGFEVLNKFSPGVADSCVAAQRLGFEAEPRLARARVGVVAQQLLHRVHAHAAGGGFGAPA